MDQKTRAQRPVIRVERTTAADIVLTVVLVWVLGLMTIGSIVLAQGCVQRTTPVEMTSLEAEAITAAIDAWRDARPVAADCPTADLDVHRAFTADEFRDLCSVEPAGACPDLAEGCASADSCLARTVGTIHTIVIAPAQRVGLDGEPVVHQTLHLLIWCANRSNYDMGHADEGVWSQHGDDTMQERARRHMLRDWL